MRIKKTVEIKCNHCNNNFFKELKEYTRQLKKGKNEFYCNLSCSAKANQVLVKNAEFSKNNPQEIIKKRKKYIKENPLARFTRVDELSPFRYYLRKIKQRLKSNLSKNKILDFDINLEEIKNQWDKQNGICPYTNKKMKLVTPKEKTDPNQASLDRIDSSKGYVKGNVEFVCLAVNYAKNNFSREQMINFFKRQN